MTGPEVRQIGPGVCGSRLQGWAAAVRNPSWQELFAHTCYLFAGSLSLTQLGAEGGISVEHPNELAHPDVLEIVRELANRIRQFRWGSRVQTR